MARGVEAQEPGPEPVVVAVLEHAQVRRRGDDEPGAVREAVGTEGRAGTRAGRAGVAVERDAGRRRQRLAVEAVQLGRQGVEDVALRRLVAGPRDEVADVARGHAEGVGHDRRQVGRRLAVEDPGQRTGEEAVRAVVEAQVRAHEQELRERARRERDGDLVRDRLRPRVRAVARAGGGHAGGRVARVRLHCVGEGEPGGRVRVPREAEGGEAGAGLGGRAGLELGRRQDVGERVEVVADADPALRAACRGAVPRPENGSRTTSPGACSGR